MKIIILILLSTILDSFQDQSPNNKLPGKWILMAMECPDVLIFKTNGEYEILNDCGSVNPHNPVAEKGKWILEKKVLKLYDRDFISPNSSFSSLFGYNEEVEFSLKNISEIRLVLQYNKGNRLIEDTYKRYEPPRFHFKSAIDMFIACSDSINSDEVNVFSSEDSKRGRDQGALLFHTKDFKVLEILRFGALGKSEVFYFIKNDSIIHSTAILYWYNMPYYMEGSKIIEKKRKDYFLNNDYQDFLESENKNLPTQDTSYISDEEFPKLDELLSEGEFFLKNLKKQ